MDNKWNYFVDFRIVIFYNTNNKIKRRNWLNRRNKQKKLNIKINMDENMQRSLKASKEMVIGPIIS